MKPSDEFLDQILNETPSSETLFLLLTNQKAEGKSVVRQCIKALCRYPGDTRIRGLLAESCFESGWLSRAELEVETATAQIEKLTHLYKLKGLIYWTLNRQEEAVRSLKIYLAHQPDDQEVLSLLESLNPANETLSTYHSAVESDSPRETSSFSLSEIATPTLAEVYFAQGQIQEAIDTYQRVLAQNPGAEQSRKRLEEFRAMVPSILQPQEDRKKEDPQRSRKEKLIRVLETWRESIQVGSK